MYILLASGLSIIFGLMRVLNFAHGSLYMVGAYFGFTVISWTGNFWLALMLWESPWKSLRSVLFMKDLIYMSLF
jgi:branched-subunit amino acid ABC-type transport system permease component